MEIGYAGERPPCRRGSTKMTSKLYEGARGALGSADRKSLATFVGWLGRVRTGASGDPVDGRQIGRNLQREAHLTGAGAFGDYAELTGFLARCATTHRGTKGMKQRVNGYGGACSSHVAKGLPIPAAHLPPRLLRYSVSRYAAAILVERVLGKAARKVFDDGSLPAEDAFRRIEARWSASTMTPTEQLGRPGSVVWATFRHKKGTPRKDAKGMAEALALSPRAGDDLLIELAYPTDKVENHRFPTVADAGLMHAFRPAREVPPDPGRRGTCWGRTKPLGPWPAQPEIVHDNASLGVLWRAPRFVGRIH
jgi:hypothetical protein